MQNNTSAGSRQGSASRTTPETIWILGAGHFGSLAARRLSRRYPEASFLVIDKEREKLDRIQRELHCPTRLEDALGFLAENVIPEDVWIVPAVPVHAVFLWLLKRLEESGKAAARPVPEQVDSQVPNPYRVPSGTLYASFATFHCPDYCSEPDEICTYTQKPRPGNLFERLARIQVPGMRVAVLQSRQLAPGVGGYKGAHLREILKAVSEESGAYLIATSCRCHAVIDVLEWEKT